MSSLGFSTVPPELLVQVIKFSTDEFRKLVELAHVSKKFEKVILSSPQIWENTHVSIEERHNSMWRFAPMVTRISMDKNAGRASDFLKNLGHVTTVKFGFKAPVEDLLHITTLTDVSYSSSHKNGESLMSLLQHNKGLKKISGPGISPTFLTFLLDNFASTLEHIAINVGSSPKGVFTPTKSFEALKVARFSSNVTPVPAIVGAVARAAICNTLQQLDITAVESEVHIPQELLEKIPASLKKFGFCALPSVLKYITEKLSLEELSMKFSSEHYAGAKAMLQTQKELRSLSITTNGTGDDDMNHDLMQDIVEIFKERQLEKLNFSYLPTKNIRYFPEGITQPSLREISINIFHCKPIHIEHLLQFAPNITTFSLSSSSFPGWDVFVTALQYGKHLKHISIDNSRYPSSNQLDSIPYSPQVEELDLHNTGFNDDQKKLALLACPKVIQNVASTPQLAHFITVQLCQEADLKKLKASPPSYQKMKSADIPEHLCEQVKAETEKILSQLSTSDWD